MSDDFDLERELEARLHGHYRRLEPGAATPGWESRVDAALRARRAQQRALQPALAAAAVVVLAVGVIGAVGISGLWSRIAAPSPSLPAPTVPVSPSGSPEASSQPSAGASVDLAGTFSPRGVWAIRGPQLLVSADAGATWRTGSAPMPQSTDGFGVRVATMFTADLGWVVTSGPGATGDGSSPNDAGPLVVSRTSDGGQTWRSTTLPGNYPGVAVSMSFADNLHGFILLTPWRPSLTRGTVLATDDGGATWRTTGSSDTWARDGMTPRLGDRFVASSGASLWAGANQEAGPVEHPILAVSRDGGATWRAAQLPAKFSGTGGPQVYLPAPPVFTGRGVGIVAVVDDGAADGTSVTRLFRTTDDGATWRQVGSIPSQAATGPLAFDDQHWLIATYNPAGLLESNDGGATWSPAASSGLPGEVWANGGGAIDSTHGYLLVTVGSGAAAPQLALTDDAGRTWHLADLGPAPAPAVSPSPTSSPVPIVSPSASPSSASPAPSADPFAPLDVAALPSPTVEPALGPGWQDGWLESATQNDLPTGWRWNGGRSAVEFAAGTFGANSLLVEHAVLGDTLILITEDGSGADTAWRTTDGVHWSTVRTDRVSMMDRGAIAAAAGALVVVRAATTPGVLVTTDGVTWQPGFTTDGSSFDPADVAEFRGEFVAVGSSRGGAAAWTSPDGLHWRAAKVRGGAGLTLTGVYAGRGGIAALASTGGVPGILSYWTGSVDNSGALTFAPSSADPLGVQASGEGVGDPVGQFAGDGSRILVWGAHGGSGAPQLWGSLDGQHWQQIALASGGSLVQQAWGPTPLGADVLFLGENGTGPWLGTPTSR